MSLNYQEISFAGHLGADPVLRIDQSSNNHYVSFSVGVTTKSNNNSHTEWFSVSYKCTEKQSEFLMLQMKKGSNVRVVGEVRTNKWKDRNSGEDRQKTVIKATNVQLISNRTTSQPPESSQHYDDYQHQDNPFPV